MKCGRAVTCKWTKGHLLAVDQKWELRKERLEQDSRDPEGGLLGTITSADGDQGKLVMRS